MRKALEIKIPVVHAELQKAALNGKCKIQLVHGMCNLTEQLVIVGPYLRIGRPTNPSESFESFESSES